MSWMTEDNTYNEIREKSLMQWLDEMEKHEDIADTLLTAWRNFAMTAFYVSGITLLYYKTSLRSAIDHLSCIGKMSLSDYLFQSIVGAFLFYNWGLALHETCSHGYSFLLAIAFLIVLYFICKFWTSRFRRGPLEEIWYRMTWVFYSFVNVSCLHTVQFGDITIENNLLVSKCDDF